MDEVKIVESSKLLVFSIPFKIETSSRTLSGPTRVCHKIQNISTETPSRTLSGF
jgi:hypothetical protein